MFTTHSSSRLFLLVLCWLISWSNFVSRSIDILVTNLHLVCIRWSKAKSKHYINGDYIRMKKFLVHSIRWLMLAGQIVQNPEREALDFTCANHVYYQIMSEQETDWIYYENKYKYELRL